jgi:hypothetical protein
MKIMLKWQLHPGKLHSILDQFSKMTPEQELELGDSQVKLICRWHDLARGSGFAVYETENAEAFAKYTLSWNEHMDLESSIVLDDDEARAVAKGLSAQ